MNKIKKTKTEKTIFEKIILTIILLAIIICLGALIYDATRPNEIIDYKYYAISYGDSLSSIITNEYGCYNLSIQNDICAYNNIGADIKAGQVIELPVYEKQ